MRKDQIAYALNRASAIFDERKRPLKAKYTTSAKRLTDEQKFEALAEGRFTVDPASAHRGTYYQPCGLLAAVSFFDEANEVFDEEGYYAELKPLTDGYNKLLDELMLGDNAKALELLREFEAK